MQNQLPFRGVKGGLYLNMKDTNKYHFLDWHHNDTVYRYTKRTISDLMQMMPFIWAFGIRYLYDREYRRTSKQRYWNISKRLKYKSGFKTRKEKIRRDLMVRDGIGCKHCHIASKPLTVDHIKPIIKGGDNCMENLQLLCVPCHIIKTRKDVYTKADYKKFQREALWEAREERREKAKKAAMGIVQANDARTLRKQMFHLRQARARRKQLAHGPFHPERFLWGASAVRHKELKTAVLQLQHQSRGERGRVLPLNAKKRGKKVRRPAFQGQTGDY